LLRLSGILQSLESAVEFAYNLIDCDDITITERFRHAVTEWLDDSGTSQDYEITKQSVTKAILLLDYFNVSGFKICQKKL
jgi:hypothetical protein